MAGPLYGLQRSRRRRMSGVSGISVVLPPNFERQSLANSGHLVPVAFTVCDRASLRQAGFAEASKEMIAIVLIAVAVGTRP
jgi:hypothetical protein